MKKIEEINEDIKKLNGNTDDISDGYHTFGELYEHRLALYVRLINETNYNRHKSKIHHDGSEFEGWFIVMGYIDGKQISYHLPNRLRDKVVCENRKMSDKWDGHMSNDVINILYGTQS